MKLKIIFVTIGLVILVSNLPLFEFFFQEDFIYRNVDRSFYYNEDGGKGRSFEGCLAMYNHFLGFHPLIKDKTLYRTFTIKPWYFWEWREMIFEPARFKLPYLEPSDPAYK